MQTKKTQELIERVFRFNKLIFLKMEKISDSTQDDGSY